MKLRVISEYILPPQLEGLAHDGMDAAKNEADPKRRQRTLVAVAGILALAMMDKKCGRIMQVLSDDGKLLIDGDLDAEHASLEADRALERARRKI